MAENPNISWQTLICSAFKVFFFFFNYVLPYFLFCGIFDGCIMLLPFLMSFPNLAWKMECKFVSEFSDTCQNKTICGENFVLGDFLIVADRYI